jgi:hypothetical protein
MIGKAFAAAALLGACVSVPADAQTARSRGSDYSHKKICKVETVAGSRLGGKRTCRTQAEWDELAREGRAVVEDFQAYAHPCMSGPNQPGKEHVVCSGGGP